MSILVTGGAGYIGSHTVVAVSYTHLDVYKRQACRTAQGKRKKPASCCL